MAEYRINVIGEESFKPREWLRREALWAYLMSPYGRQLDDWKNENGTRFDQHIGNVSRQSIYAEQPDPESHALSFFNQGKHIGGLITSAAMLRAGVASENRLVVDVLALQTRAVDISLAGRVQCVLKSDFEVFSQTAKLVRDADAVSLGQYGRNQRLVRASGNMMNLASEETIAWLEVATQNETNPLPTLTVNDGGHPRSVGPRVEMLQPIFHDILNSDGYLRFSPVA
jgi:hypothetical protein